jgi:hypothetical protein
MKYTHVGKVSLGTDIPISSKQKVTGLIPQNYNRNPHAQTTSTITYLESVSE